MSRECSHLQSTTLNIDELDQVIGGRGIFESIGRSTGWYSEKAGMGLDIGSQLALSPIPYVGTAYGVAQGAVDTATTTYDYFHGDATLGQVGVAVAGLVVSAVPGGALFHGLGTPAESAVDTLVTTGTIAGQTLANGLLTLGHETPNESHPDGGADHGVDAAGTSSSSDHGLDLGMPGDHSAPESSDQGSQDTGEHGVQDAVDHSAQDASPDHGGEEIGDQSDGGLAHGDQGNDAASDFGGNDFGNDFGGDDFGGGYFGNDFGDSNFGGGDFGGGDFGGSDFA